MTILALDTASDQASVAVHKLGRLVASESLTTRDGHSQLIFPMIARVLEQASVELADIDCFAAASGPGSFTGVRICLTVVKGLAESFGKPAAGISNLRALATLGSGKMRNPVLDARRGQIYTAIYDDNHLLVSPEVVVDSSAWRPTFDVERIESSVSLASAIALCAEWDGALRWQSAMELDANYVRRSDAGLFWADKS